MTNLVMCELIQDRLRGDSGDQDIQYFIIFAQTDDVATQCAATGALAMLSQDPELAVKIARCSLQTAHQPSHDDTDDDIKAKAKAAADEVRAAEEKQAKRAALAAAQQEKKNNNTDNKTTTNTSNSSSGMTIEVIDDEEDEKEKVALKAAKAKAKKAAAAAAAAASSSSTNNNNNESGKKLLQKTGLSLLESMVNDNTCDANVLKRVQFALTNVKAALEADTTSTSQQLVTASATSDDGIAVDAGEQ
jgi:hypothetical protein